LLSPVGAVIDQLTVSADAAGAARLLAFVDGVAPGARRAFVIDGTRSHGIGLTRHLHSAGEQVIEAARIPGAARRRGGKSDTLDAIAVARAALAVEHTATPRADGDREALRILVTCRRHYTDQRTAAVNLVKSLILTADDQLRAHLRDLPTRQQVRYLAHLDPGQHTDTATRVRHTYLRALADQILTLDRHLAANLTDIRTLVTRQCPALLDLPGVGPVTAAIALTTWSHHGRVRNDAAYAALAGTNPIPASSGRTTRHRLNRGGDRTLNAAIHTIAITRRRCHQPTADYIARRTTQGLTPREITRCLKRYITRQLYRTMQATTATA
jgi:transposase